MVPSMCRNSRKSVPRHSRISAAVHRRTALRWALLLGGALFVRERARLLRPPRPLFLNDSHPWRGRLLTRLRWLPPQPICRDQVFQRVFQETRGAHDVARRISRCPRASSIRSVARTRDGSCTTGDRPAEDATERFHDVAHRVRHAGADVEHVESARAPAPPASRRPRHAYRYSRGAARCFPARSCPMSAATRKCEGSRAGSSRAARSALNRRRMLVEISVSS